MAKKRRRRRKKHIKNNNIITQRLKDRHNDVLRYDDDYYKNVRKIKNKDRRLISLKESIVMAHRGFSPSIEPGRIVNKTLQSPIKDAIINKKEVVCVKRSEKRRSLFRTGRAGKGVAGPIKRVLNLNSKVRCK